MEARPKIDLENKVVLITGAAQGIGLAATQALLKNGARVSTCIYGGTILVSQATLSQPHPEKEHKLYGLRD